MVSRSITRKDNYSTGLWKMPVMVEQEVKVLPSVV